MSHSKDTMFAPAARANGDSIRSDAKFLLREGLAEHITHVIPTILMVLNKQRQVVYKNRRLMELLAPASDADVLGKRPGELLDCIHASEDLSGCGTTEFCRECGAVQAILKSQIEKAGVETECRVTTNSGQVFEFRVWASPLAEDDREFTIFSLQDISNEKRRDALEHTFFHDLKNILTVIIGEADLLMGSDNKPGLAGSLETIHLATRELAAEVESQQKLLLAENGVLSVVMETGVSSEGLVTELGRLHGRKWPNGPILRKGICQEFPLTTDRSLLFRVLYNMVKNAVEASEPLQEVTVQCTREGNMGLFSVHNPGCMPRATELQIFQRTFSTKGKGRGLGTYSMKLFGEKYLNGQVRFSTSREKGTTFEILLPLGDT